MRIKQKIVAAWFVAAITAAGLCQAGTLDLDAFTMRVPITFSGYSGASTLNNFPVLVKLSGDIQGFSYDAFGENGVNLRFADAADEELDYEIDTWDPDGTSLVWVRVPELTSSTEIYAYWGAGYTEHAPSQTNGAVWQASDFFGVWHLAEADSVPDSSGNGLDGTSYNTTGVSGGMIGACRMISNGAQNGKDGNGIEIPNYNSLGVGNTFTVSTWLKYKSGQLPGYDRIIGRKSAYNDSNGWEVTLRQGSTTHMDHRGASATSQASEVFTSVNNGQWQFITVVYDGTTSKAYHNGVLKSTKTLDAAATDNNKTCVIGNNQARSETSFKGSLDEVRLRDAISSDDWIAAEYATVAQADFAAYGMAEELNPDLPRLAVPQLVSVDFHSAEIAWSLIRAGASTPGVVLVYGTDPGQMNSTSVLASALSDPGSFTNTLSGLSCNTTYYARIVASNNHGLAETPTVSFKTPGEPKLGAAAMSATADALQASCSLTDVGVSDTTVELWLGTAPDSLVKIREWAGISSVQSFSETIANRPLGIHYAAFRAYNVCDGATNEIWSATVHATICGSCVWTGEGQDLNWNNAANWSSGTVPGATDAAVFTAVGLSGGNTISLNANQAVAKVAVFEAPSFTIGHADDVTAGYSLTLTDFDSQNVDPSAKIYSLAAPVNIAPDVASNSTWSVGANDTVRMNAVLGSTGPATFVKMGAGTFSMRFRSPTYSGPWRIVEGSVTAWYGSSIAYSESGTMRGNVTIGGTPAKASLVQSTANALYNDMNINVLTNGSFTSNNVGVEHGRVRSIHVREGGIATVSYPWFYCYLVYLTGGTITGASNANFWGGGNGQTITTYASSQTAYLDIGFTLSSYYDFVISVQDGEAPVDLDMTRGSIKENGKTVKKQGAGTVVFGQPSTHLHSSGTNEVGFVIEGGRAIFNNATGSGSGKNRLQVNGGATIGGAGFLGGDSAHANYGVLVQGASESSIASVEPGSVDPATGDSLPGTLTVGSETAPNYVTFGANSRLNLQIGADGVSDMLDVYGSVNISAVASTLSLTVDPNATPGTYVLVRASGGINGTFAALAEGFPHPPHLKYKAGSIEYTVAPRGTFIIIK